MSVVELAIFITYQYNEGCVGTTLSSIASAVSYGRKIRALPDPALDFRIRQMLTGARRIRPSQDARAAITVSELARLCTALNFTGMPPMERVAFREIFTLAFLHFRGPVKS